MPKLYRDATTGQFTTAEDAAARPAETVAETVEARHETPDVAELRRLAEAATPGPWDFHRPHPAYRVYSIEQVMPEGHLGEAVAVTEDGAVEGNAAYIAAASPDVVLGLLDRLAHMREARDNARAERDALVADADKWQRAALTLQRDRDALTDERDSLSWQVEALRAERDARSSERDALAAKVDAVRALHTPVRYYTDPCDDPECERELVELSVGDYYHADTFELMCEVCSGGDMSECDYDNAVPHPCPTVRALDEEPQP